MSLLADVLADLEAESAALAARLAGLPDDASGWRRTTPAPGWDVAHQVAHLTWTDEVARLAVRAAQDDTAGDIPGDAPGDWDAVVSAALDDPDGFVDAAAAAVAASPARALLDRWARARGSLADALRDLPQAARVPWFGPPMSAASMATARFMETWAHGHDVTTALADGGDTDVAPTDRIRHVAHLGVRTRGFAFAAHGLAVPDAEVRVELVAPSGAVWVWGPEDAEQCVSGPAYDFCLRVTQRRPRSALALSAVGEVADRWLDVAQCFAGPPGAGSGAGSEGRGHG